MFELAVGTRFRYNGSLCEAIEMKHDSCSECEISGYECIMMACASVSRQDNKNVCFKLVEE